MDGKVGKNDLLELEIQRKIKQLEEKYPGQKIIRKGNNIFAGDKSIQKMVVGLNMDETHRKKRLVSLGSKAASHLKLPGDLMGQIVTGMEQSRRPESLLIPKGRGDLDRKPPERHKGEHKTTPLMKKIRKKKAQKRLSMGISKNHKKRKPSDRPQRGKKQKSNQ
tara:strand:- start:83 stop:574 length:492 start_codon:yes stop_codon:yes gene_type:complete